MAFNKYSFLWPPRPTKAIGTNMLKFYEKRNWVAQYKKNGTCTVLYVTPEKEIIVRTRHDDEHKRWEPTAKSTDVFKELPGEGWYVFIVEVMHSKFKGLKDTVYIFDMLVNDGQELTGSTFMERQDILMGLFDINQNEDDTVVNLFTPSHYVITPNVWLARLVKEGFRDTMDMISRQAPEEGAPENEGLVFKNPDARLEPTTRQTANGGWMVKCRIPHKNYSF